MNYYDEWCDPELIGEVTERVIDHIRNFRDLNWCRVLSVVLVLFIVDVFKIDRRSCI